MWNTFWGFQVWGVIIGYPFWLFFLGKTRGSTSFALAETHHGNPLGNANRPVYSFLGGPEGYHRLLFQGLRALLLFPSSLALFMSHYWWPSLRPHHGVYQEWAGGCHCLTFSFGKGQAVFTVHLPQVLIGSHRVINVFHLFALFVGYHLQPSKQSHRKENYPSPRYSL